jgi:hypothetical protein
MVVLQLKGNSKIVINRESYPEYSPISRVNLDGLTLTLLSAMNKTRCPVPHRPLGQYSRMRRSGSKFLAGISSSSDFRTGKISTAKKSDENQTHTACEA